MALVFILITLPPNLMMQVYGARLKDIAIKNKWPNVEA